MAVVVFSRNADRLLVSFACVGDTVHVDHSCELRDVRPPIPLAHSALPIAEEQPLMGKPMDYSGRVITCTHSCSGNPRASVALTFNVLEQVGNKRPRRIGGHQALAFELDANGVGTKSVPYELQAEPAT